MPTPFFSYLSSSSPQPSGKVTSTFGFRTSKALLNSSITSMALRTVG
nr:MAG TPA: hypothetical protein [Caudoviricetes sp.]